MIEIQDKRVRERGRSEGAKIYRERLERVKDKRESERGEGKWEGDCLYQLLLIL